MSIQFTSSKEPKRGGRPWAVGAVVLVLALVLAACGSDSSTTTTEGSGTQTTEAASPTTTEQMTSTTEAMTSTTMGGIQVGDDGKLLPLADGFPDSPITLWAGFPVGASDDLLNRAFQPVAEKYSPVPIGAEAYEAGNNFTLELYDNYMPTLPRADEGYHLWDSNLVGLAVRPYSTESAAQYEWDELQPILGGVSFKPFIYVVNLDSPYESLDDVIAAAQTENLRFCSGTPTSTTTIAGDVWLADAGIEMTFVPNEGNTGGRATMAGGGCEFGVFSLYPGASDEFKILATNYKEAINALPEYPTLESLGYSTVGGSLQGYGTLKEVPEEHVAWLTELVKMTANDPEFAQTNVAGAYSGYIEPADVLTSMQGDVTAFYPILEQLGIATKPAPDFG